MVAFRTSANKIRAEAKSVARLILNEVRATQPKRLSQFGSLVFLVIPAEERVKKLMSGAGILPASDANSGGNAWLPASPERGRDARATRFSNSFTRSDQGNDEKNVKMCEYGSACAGMTTFGDSM
jgi:hypothetical protein